MITSILARSIAKTVQLVQWNLYTNILVFSTSACILVIYLFLNVLQCCISIVMFQKLKVHINIQQLIYILSVLICPRLYECTFMYKKVSGFYTLLIWYLCSCLHAFQGGYLCNFLHPFQCVYLCNLFTVKAVQKYTKIIFMVTLNSLLVNLTCMFVTIHVYLGFV